MGGEGVYEGGEVCEKLRNISLSRKDGKGGILIHVAQKANLQNLRIFVVESASLRQKSEW